MRAYASYAKEVLEDLGYGVIEASNAEDGLEQLAKHQRIDLLFTDVVLPGAANGRVLAD